MSEEDKNNKPNTGNIGIGIALGAGLGVVFGQFIFGSMGVGIAIGVGLGIAFSKYYKSK